MRALHRKERAPKVFYPLVLSAAIWAAFPGAAAAFVPVQDFDFCSPDSYPNAFTDIRRGDQINDDYANCTLNLTGSTGSAGDMWITVVDGAEGTPTPQCVSLTAQVLIKKYDNRKAVGFVTNLSGGGKGLFLGLYDNGNTDAMTLSTFDASTGKLGTTVANKSLGSKIQENVWYQLELDICNNGAHLVGQASVEPFPPAGGPACTGAQACLDIDTALPAGISVDGRIGIAGYAKSSFVDSSVKNFSWDSNP